MLYQNSLSVYNFILATILLYAMADTELCMCKLIAIESTIFEFRICISNLASISFKEPFLVLI